MKKILHKIISRKSLIILLTLAVIGVNVFYLFVFTVKKSLAELDWYEPGYQFLQFQEYLKNEKEIGYITNLNQTREKNDGILLQAQYFLAPIIIKEGYHNDTFNIIDSEDIPFIVKTFHQTNSKRLINNAYGQALMKKR